MVRKNTRNNRKMRKHRKSRRTQRGGAGKCGASCTNGGAHNMVFVGATKMQKCSVCGCMQYA